MKQKQTNIEEKIVTDSSLIYEFNKIKDKKTAVLKINQVPFKSVLTRIKKIKDRNAMFETLDKCGQIREIALDALNLLMFNENVQAADGHYWSTTLLHRLSKHLESPKDFQKSLLKKVPSCTVCQRGLLMLSQARTCGIDFVTHYEVNSNQISMGNEILTKGLFTERELDEMEVEYEANDFAHPYKNDTKEKLANIICNILVNCGFNTDDYTDYLKKWNIKLTSNSKEYEH